MLDRLYSKYSSCLRDIEIHSKIDDGVHNNGFSMKVYGLFIYSFSIKLHSPGTYSYRGNIKKTVIA